MKDKTAKISMQEILLLLDKKLVYFNKKTKYVAKIGSIIYIIVEIQIHIMFATSNINRFEKKIRVKPL